MIDDLCEAVEGEVHHGKFDRVLCRVIGKRLLLVGCLVIEIVTRAC